MLIIGVSLREFLALYSGTVTTPTTGGNMTPPSVMFPDTITETEIVDYLYVPIPGNGHKE